MIQGRLSEDYSKFHPARANITLRESTSGVFDYNRTRFHQIREMPWSQKHVPTFKSQFPIEIQRELRFKFRGGILLIAANLFETP